jgi:glucosamine-6-phosphate deaminase
MLAGNGKVRSFQVETAKVEIYPDAVSMGKAAAQAAAEAINEIEKRQETINVIFATGASQLATLDALTKIDNLPWARVRGFHMDEYIGLPISHPASFRGYLREKLTEKVSLKEFNEVDGTAPDAEAFSRDYAAKLRAAEPQLCLMGIGENGHLAFNDPGVADFNDPLDVKVVHLDRMCREQQAAEGWFASIGEVPEFAITITIPALLRVPRLIVSVPGSRKAAIVRRSLTKSISTDCPATILRAHPNATIYLDEASAAELDDLFPEP